MPNYDFHCTSCGYDFSQQLSMSARKNAVCAKCGSTALEQVFKRCNVLGGPHTTNSTSKAACSRTGGCAGCSGC